MKLWDKGTKVNEKIEKFTVGIDYLLDQRLVKFDCIASKAHAKMLGKIGILTAEELKLLLNGIEEIIKLDSEGKFKIDPKSEDCHTAIENFLTLKYGDAGKKIHTARSRNDQVLTALRLYEKHELHDISKLMYELKRSMEKTAKKFGKTNMPGYTHMQKAMPTSIATWLGCFVSAIDDDLFLLAGISKMIDQSPLGSAAGFGVPVLNIDKSLTSKEMKFSRIMENPIYCQMSRGKFESTVMHLISTIMFDLNKLATDLIIFSMEEFGYIAIPKEFCTGSSIMPQKNNPDPLELIRAKYHIVLGEEFKVKSLIGNLMSGYNRDLQLTKEPLFNSIDIVKSSLEIMSLIIDGINVDKKKCMKAMSKELFATEKAYELVSSGMPFRDAYQKVAKDLAKKD